MKTDGKVIKYMKDVRRPKNDESFVKTARAALSHLQFWLQHYWPIHHSQPQT